MDKEKIGTLIKNARKEKKLTQQQLAEKLFVSNKAVSNWETGKNIPDISIIDNIDKELDIDLKNMILLINNQRKQRLKKVLMILLLIIFITLTAYFITNFNKLSVYSIETENGNYELVDSYITAGPNYTILSFDNLINYDMPVQYKYSIEIYI